LTITYKYNYEYPVKSLYITTNHSDCLFKWLWELVLVTYIVHKMFHLTIG